MPKRYARLTEDWLLRGWSDLPFAAVNWKSGDVRPVNPRIAHVLKGCDGATDFDSMLFLPIHRKILDKLIDVEIAAECVEGETFAPVQGYRRADNPYIHGIHWSVTGRCNLNCRHCYMEAPGKRYIDMCAADARRVIEQLARANVLRVGITGGEPFVREDLFSIIQQLLDCRILVHQIYSNGLLVTDRVLGQIKAMGLSPSFHLSFDGCGAHDRMRGTKGAEKPVLEAIERIRAAGLRVNVATSVDRLSRECLPETYARLKALKVQSWQVAPPNSSGNWCGSDTTIAPADEAALYGPILRRWQEDGKPFALQLGAFFNSRVDEVEDEHTRFLIRYTQESYECRVCRLVPYLLPDGTLLPCHGFTGTSLQKSMPNVLQQELAAIWTSSNLRDLAQAKKSERLAANEECANCDFFERCGMGCRARALIAAGDIKSKDPLTCEMWKKGYKQSLLG